MNFHPTEPAAGGRLLVALRHVLHLVRDREVRVEDLERGLLGVDRNFALRSRRLRSLGGGLSHSFTDGGHR